MTNTKYRVFYLKIIYIALLLSLTGCSFIPNKNSISNNDILEVHYIDVGQGDSTLITCNGESMLIDAGDNDKGTLIQSYLKSNNISKLKYVIGTHPDADHIGGLDVILYKFDCETIILPDVKKDTKTYDDVIQTMKNKHYKATYPVVGDIYNLGESSFTIISPNNNDYGNNTNDYSVGIILQHGNNKFIFTGDAEEKSEIDILENTIDISSNVYKVSHHGSRTSSTNEFINAINPEYAVISCGEGNSYGHPHGQILNDLRRKNVKVFRTDEQGSIIATSDGESIKWNASPSETWQSGEGVVSDKEDDKLISSISKGVSYIVNVNTKKFHYPVCNSVGTISDKNRMKSDLSKDELINQGYEPCGGCKP